jgi:hypothetical protein
VEIDNVDYVMEPARKTPVVAATDVLVVGGGPAGIAAAVAAARAGSRALLAERYGAFGGMATTALVGPLMSYHTTVVIGNKPEQVVAGVLDELVQRMVAIGGAMPPGPDWDYMTLIDAEAFKTVARQMALEAGVRSLLHSLAVGVIADGSRIEGVVFETKSGRLAVRARVVVDATGDGDVAAFAGAPFEVGREGDCLCQPMSLIFKLGGVDLGRFQVYARAHPGEFSLAQGLRSLVAEAARRGDLDLAREDILFFPTPAPDEVVVNSTRVTRVSGIDVWDLTAAEIEGHRQAEMLVKFFRGYAPGFERCRLLQTGQQIGVRETRRVRGDYALTAEDVLGGARFEDVVARGCYPLDVHNPEGPGTVMRRLPAGASYDIPYRCLLPREVEGLLVAGRSISGTHEAQSSYRVIPICMASGQAAGVAAALSAQRGVSPRSMGVRAVQTELRRQGASLRQLAPDAVGPVSG